MTSGNIKDKLRLFGKAVRLVWNSSPYWTSANILISVLRSIFPLGIIWLLKMVIDVITKMTVSPNAVPDRTLLLTSIALVIVWFLDEASADLSNFIRKNQANRLEDYMYSLLHERSVSLDLINFERPDYFDRLSRAIREAPWRPNNILNNLVSVFRGLFSLLLMTGLILTLHWTLAVLLLVANIPGIWLRLHYAGLLYNFQKKQTPEARKAAYFSWLLTGDRPSRELRLFNLGEYFSDLFRKSYSKQKQEEISILRRRTLIEFISNAFKASVFLVSLLFIIRQTITGRLSLGQLAMFLVAFRQGMMYTKDLFSSLAGLYEDGLFIGDTFEFLELKEKVTAIEPVKKTGELENKIIVKDLSFRYPGNSTTTISNVSFELKKGEIIALVGSNGAGKSTLVRLLSRLYDPDSGKIMYDGDDIRHMDPKEYRKQFSVVFQDFMLYNLSAAENIRMGNIDKESSSGKIVESAKTAGVHDLINELPGRYETPIGNLFDDSRELSWGEWQKFALARAIFRDSSVLILDEPSSALDAVSEYEIFSRFREIVRGRTCILISHRFTNVNLADRIIVLDKGTIAEEGTHEELMKSGGLYAKMYSMQSNRFQQ